MIEGFHGVPYDKPLARTREIVDIIRRGLRRETLTNDGIYKLPLPEGQGTGLGKPLKLLNKPERDAVPIFIAALGPKNVARRRRVRRRLAAVPLPPREGPRWSGATRSQKGTAKRQEGLAPLEISAGGMVAIGEDVKGDARLHAADVRALRRRHGRTRQELLQRPRLPVRLREGGQGDPGPLPRRQQAGRRGARCPLEWLEAGNLVGPASYVKERIAAFREAGVTNLQVAPASDDPAATIAQVKEWVS